MGRTRVRLVEDEPNYEDRFRNYRFELVWNSPEALNPEREVIDVRLTTNDGKNYSANFVARGFLDWVFEKNKKTGECAEGTYFAVPRMIVVERIDEVSVRKTIDDMINNWEIDNYFSPMP